MLNIGEGRGRTGGDQRRFFEIAHGSANEVRTALECAECWGWPIAPDAARVTLDRVVAMLWRLARPR
jgi:four helix bundle protein